MTDHAQHTLQSALLQVTNELLTNEISPAVYQRLLGQAVDLVPSAQAGSVLVRRDDGRFYYEAAYGFDLEGLTTISFGERELYFRALDLPTQASYVVIQLDNINLQQLDPERLAVLQKAGATREIKTSLGVPIYLDGEVAALLSLENLDTEDAFSEQDREIAETLGSQVGLVFRHLQVEAALQAKEERLRLHIEQTPLAVIEWDPDAKVTAWNEAAERIFGYRAEEVIGQRTTAFIVPEGVRPHTDEVWAALVENRGGYRSTNRNVTRDGRTIICDWYNTPLVDEAGEVVGVASLAQDITERVQAEERFQKMFRAAPVVASLSTLKDGILLNVNNAFCTLTGYLWDELVGKRVAELDLIVDAPERERGISELLAQGSLGDIELRVRSQVGGLRHLLGSVVVLEIGGESYALSMFLDVTERKRSEEQLAQAIQAVLDDSSWFGSAVMEQLANLKTGETRPPVVTDLTEREREVFALLAKGLNNAQIASRLNISKATVRNHVSRIYSKLNLKSRAEAVVWARERGLVTGG